MEDTPDHWRKHQWTVRAHQLWCAHRSVRPPPGCRTQATIERRKGATMTVESDAELRALMRIGRIVGLTLKELAGLVEPGMTTEDLDNEGARILDRHGATSAPPAVYGFPKPFCISLNEEAAHGIPRDHPLQPNDFVKIDLTAELSGYM